MSSKKQIISGEASESDDEQEQHSSTTVSGNIQKVFHGNIKSNMNAKYGYEIAEDALTKNPNEDINKKFNTIDLQYKSESDSMLKKNLIETNTSFWFSINHLIQSKISTLSKQLLTAEQLLLKSQVTLQSISLNLKNINTTSVEIVNKTNDVIINSNFIPDINIPK